MNSTTVLGVIVALLVAIVGFQTFQLISISNKVTGATVASGSSAVASGSSGSIDMTGWTADEIMNYQHHGIIPARLQQGQQQTPQQGVGGC